MIDNGEIQKALFNYFHAVKNLKRLGIMPNARSFTCQIGEWLVAQVYNGKFAESSIQQGWDISVGKSNIQVKTHAKSDSNNKSSSRFSYIKKRSPNVHEVIILIFTEDYKLREFYKAPWEAVNPLIREYKDGDKIYWDDLSNYLVNINDLPRQELITMFR